MKGKTGLVIDCDLKGRLHELFANGPHFRVQSCTVHHDLFLMRRHFEDGLHILSHIKGSQHVVTFIKNEMLQV